MSDNIHTKASKQHETATFTVTRQMDADVIDKVDRQAFQEAAQQVQLPEVIADHAFVFVTLICQATDEGQNEIWEQDGGAYITISLPHDFVLNHSTEEVTEKFLATYRDFIREVVEVPPISSLEAEG